MFFSNKTSKDIILEDELIKILGNEAYFIITDEPGSRFHNGYINKEFLQEHIADFSKHFYVCGPPKMTEAIAVSLKELGVAADSVVFEK